MYIGIDNKGNYIDSGDKPVLEENSSVKEIIYLDDGILEFIGTNNVDDFIFKTRDRQLKVLKK